jgi:hypothetical protein
MNSRICWAMLAAVMLGALARATMLRESYIDGSGAESARLIANDPGGVWRLRWGMRPRDVRKVAALDKLLWNDEFLGVAYACFLRPPRVFGFDARQVRVHFAVDHQRKESRLIGVEFALPGTAYDAVCAALTNVYGETAGNLHVDILHTSEFCRTEWKAWIGRATRIAVVRQNFERGPWSETILKFESIDAFDRIFAYEIVMRSAKLYERKKEAQREIYD